MRKFAGVMMMVAVLGMAFSLMAAEKKDESKLKDIKCPVSGRDVDASKTVEYKNGKVYFCCANCPKAFKQNTEKFAAKANHQLAATKQAKQKACPLTGRNLNKKQTAKVTGVKVTFCCGNCKGKVAAAEGEKQINLVFSDKAFAKGFKVPEEKDEK